MVGTNNNKGYETLIKVLAEHEFLDLCTPVIFGSQQMAIQTAKAVQTEQQINFNLIRNVSDAFDGRVNMLDNLEQETDSLAAATDAYMNNCVDVIVVIADQLSNDAEKRNISNQIIQAIQADRNDVYDWVISEKTRTLILQPFAINDQIDETSASEAFINDLTIINKSLRKDFTLIKPLIAVVSDTEQLHKDIAVLREQGVMAFGPFKADKFVSDGNYASYDAVLFLGQDAACQSIIDSMNSEKTYGYISGLPMVVTYTANKNLEPQNIKQAIYSAIDTYKARIQYRRATSNPLEKQWIPRGRDDFKLDLTKEESD